MNKIWNACILPKFCSAVYQIYKSIRGIHSKRHNVHTHCYSSSLNYSYSRRHNVLFHSPNWAEFQNDEDNQRRQSSAISMQHSPPPSTVCQVFHIVPHWMICGCRQHWGLVLLDIQQQKQLYFFPTQSATIRSTNVLKPSNPGPTLHGINRAGGEEAEGEGGAGEGQGQCASSRGQRVNCRALPAGPFISRLTQTDYTSHTPPPPPPPCLSLSLSHTPFFITRSSPALSSPLPFVGFCFSCFSGSYKCIKSVAFMTRR